jgi:hypothetical protein
MEPAEHARARSGDHDDGPGERAGERVALHEAPHRVETATATGVDRAVRQPALQLFDQGIDGGVAVGGQQRDGPQGDGIQVATEMAVQLSRASIPPLPGDVRRSRHRQCRRGLRGRRGGQADEARVQGRQRARPVVDEQPVQHHAHRIDVAGCGGGSARKHFRRGVPVGDGEPRGHRRFQSIDHRRQPEIDQVHAAIEGYQQIARLDVLVQHAAAMRVAERMADLQQQADTLGQRQALLVRPGIHGGAAHEAHGEPGPAIRFDAAIQQGRDMRMVELRQVVALAHEGVDQRRRRHSRSHAFQRDLLLVLAVDAAGLVHGSHAARLEHAIDAPGPEPIAYAGRRIIVVVTSMRVPQRSERRVSQRIRLVVRRQQPGQDVMECGIACLQSREGGRALRPSHPDVRVEQIQCAGLQVGHRRQSVRAGRLACGMRRPWAHWRERIALRGCWAHYE